MVIGRPPLVFVFCLATFAMLIGACDGGKQSSHRETAAGDRHVATSENTSSDTQPAVRTVLVQQDIENAYPHWSRDGKEILFQSNVTGTWQLYVMDEYGGNIRRITEGDANNYFPDWSPANDQVCFISDRTGNEEVYVLDVNTHEVTQLTDDPAREIHPYWTPDGSHILFNSTRNAEGGLDVYRMNPDGSDVSRLTSSTDNETCARLSPDGTRAVYLRNNRTGLDDVFMLTIDGGDITNLTNTPTRDGWPCWTPDGSAIVYSAVEDDRYKIFRMDLATGNIERLTDPPSSYDDGRANISHDGRKMVFNRQISLEKNTIGIYVMQLH